MVPDFSRHFLGVVSSNGSLWGYSLYLVVLMTWLIPGAACSKAWVCGRSRAGIAGSNPAGGVDVVSVVSVV